jgi:ParB family chromosome partitioning protein
MQLFAHAAAATINILREPYARRPGALEHGELVAADVALDMVEAGWTPTVDNYLGRVPKPRILEAVREACGDQQAQLLDHLKKADMAREAERLLTGTGWLPEPLRLAAAEDVTEGETLSAATDDPDAIDNVVALPAFLATDDGEDESTGYDDERAAAE